MSGKFEKDSESLDSIIRAFYEIVSGPAGAPRQWERDKWIHARDARIQVHTGDRAQPFISLTLAQYHERANRHERIGFYEEEIHRKTDQFGDMAHVWSTYQWRKTLDGQWEGRGINSIQLHYIDDRWWISSWTFFSEDESHPIPSEYLP